jgi:hypothetical protein
MSTITHLLDTNLATADDRPVTLRLRVAFRRVALTRQLADGADLTGTPELALHARQLTTARSRQRLARTLRSAVTEARRPVLTRGRSTIVSRRAVLKAVDELDLLAKRLHSPAPVTPRGMALVDRLVTDGEWSPLYGSADPDALRRLVIVTTTALDVPDADAATAVRTPDDGAAFDHSR